MFATVSKRINAWLDQPVGPVLRWLYAFLNLGALAPVAHCEILKQNKTGLMRRITLSHQMPLPKELSSEDARKEIGSHLSRMMDICKCGFLLATDEEVELHIELSEQVASCALTLKLIAQALAVPFKQGRPTNHLQQVDLETRCSRPSHHGYEHAVGGYISESVCEWLRKRAGQYEPNSYGHTPLPQPVVLAMRQAWAAVAPRKLKEWARECGGFVAEDGRFSLQCFGTACDISIYPDQLSMSPSRSVRFGCHNLDTALQQLTLVSGLAKLCELARKDE